jgi:hypothetical protein
VVHSPQLCGLLHAFLCLQEVVDISPAMPLLLGVADGAQLYHVLRVRRPLLHRAW